MAPTKTGYSFGGWWTKTNGGGTQFTTSTTVNANITVYAKWTSYPSTTYTVTYYVNGNTGGTVPTDTNYYTTGQKVTVLGNTGKLEKAGYAFVGWNNISDSSGTIFHAGDTFTIGSSNVNLSVVWETAYSVIYDGNGNTGGSAPVDLTEYVPGDTVTVLANATNFVKEQDGVSLRFAGWNTTTNTYHAGSTFTIYSSDVTLVAQWEVIGGIGPAGGYVFYDNLSYTTDSTGVSYRYMECAKTDQSAGIRWDNGSSTSISSLGLSGGIGYGRGNTTAIIAVMSTGNYAAQACASLSVNGHNDWYLPSIGELDAMYNNLYVTGLGGFSSFSYWSSSKYYLDGVVECKNFANGNDGRTSPSSTLYTRAVRTF
jgi:uncharacterized repeat protein (TIGR02543 family)